MFVFRRWLRKRSGKLPAAMRDWTEPGTEFAQDPQANLKLLEKTFENCSDVVFQNVKLPGEREALLIYLDGMVDRQLLDQQMRLGAVARDRGGAPASPGKLAEELDSRLGTGGTRTVNTLGEFAKGVMGGQVGVVLDGEPCILIVGAGRPPSRSVEEPQAETLIRGPREGFIEQIQTNMALLRKRFPTTRLKMEPFTVGELSDTKVVVAYLEGIATDSVVLEVRNRIARIRIDGIVESGYVEEFIEDLPFSPFPQVLNTERPDVVAAHLLEGRVAILIGGTPFALLVPMTFWSGLQSAEDYYERFPIGTFLRWIRFAHLLIALFLPSVYVAISTFHQEMIPTNLLMSIAGAREANPFPALVEVLLMEITFEALREAGVRLPKQVGAAVSIVGALVIGQAAVQAGIISAPMVIVVAVTGIANFSIPRFNFAASIRLLRFPMILLAGTLGLFGIGIGLLGILIHLCSLRSFGIPYFSPVAPLSFGGLKDVVIRSPHWAMKLRPRLTGYQDPVRVPEGQMPRPGASGKQGNQGGGAP
ncbi:spore germination protein [Cohnella sp. CFH 77786]|uniref:spore germination protein n=1 Tax=Cohnella sp. CFH 77786 TaxID=2662265 RepID=UPI001C60FC45|nr:spore germination protein [Cohnella sp. CFH 77786]MBW5445674.1 spore germination protein [Cohnella sp. CFH 77786]